MLSPRCSVTMDLCQQRTLQPFGCQEQVVGSPPPSSPSPSHPRDAAPAGQQHSSLRGLEMPIFEELSPRHP